MSLAIKGIIPAVTLFHKNGEVNEEVLRQLVNHLIDGGVHGPSQSEAKESSSRPPLKKRAVSSR